MIGTAQERLREIDGMYPVWETETIWNRFEKAAKRFADHDYIVFEDVTVTYAETAERSVAISNSLYAMGVRKDSRVAVRLSNCPEFVYLTFALSRLGAVKIPVNMSLGKAEFNHILNCAEADYLIVEHTVDQPLMVECPRLKKTVTLEAHDGAEHENLLLWSDFLALATPETAAAAAALAATVTDGSALSDIMFTSGSTSLPKGAMLTGDGLQRSAFGSVRTRRFELGRRMLVMVPLFHAFAYVEALLALPFVGGTMFMSRQKFHTAYTLELLKKYRINDTILLGSMMAKLTVEARERNMQFPDLHAVFFGENSLEWLWDECRRVFDLNDVTTGSGMTEVSGAAFMSNPETPPEYLRMNYSGRLKQAGCAGNPDFGGALMETTIHDPETGELSAPGEVGELWYRGVTVTKGYINNEAANAKSFTADGWFKSGDLWKRGKDGYSIYTGRISDTFKVNGENVSPKYLDEVIGKSPDVTVVSTVGVQHPIKGKMVGVAFIEPVTDDEETHRRIECYCSANLAKFQVPRYYFYSNCRDWPRTGTNKISKKDLRAWAQELIKEKAGD